MHAWGIFNIADCDSPMGMENNQIANSQLSAASMVCA